MTRMSKKAIRRATCPRKRTPLFADKTGPKKDNLANGFREHENAISSNKSFIPKVK